MNRDLEHDDLIELGTASSDTLGSPIPNPDEAVGFLPTGLSVE